MVIGRIMKSGSFFQHSVTSRQFFYSRELLMFPLSHTVVNTRLIFQHLLHFPSSKPFLSCCIVYGSSSNEIVPNVLHPAVIHGLYANVKYIRERVVSVPWRKSLGAAGVWSFSFFFFFMYKISLVLNFWLLHTSYWLQRIDAYCN